MRRGLAEIDAYLASLDPVRRAALSKLRRTLRSILPAAEECMSYGLPAFRLGEGVVAGFAATKTGCSYYPFSGLTLGALADELSGYRQTKSALHFQPDRPLSTTLVRKLIETRMAEAKGSLSPSTREAGCTRTR
jgi:uncharacterized protein YdhG (YjbR/CyaY superfamily)